MSVPHIAERWTLMSTSLWPTAGSQLRPPPLLDHLPFSQREPEKRLDLEAAQFAR
jgi:hypothetical protein